MQRDSYESRCKITAPNSYKVGEKRILLILYYFWAR